MDAKALLGVDPVLIDRVRLVIMAALAAAEGPVEFMTLLDSLELSRGNLSSHLRKLEEAGMIEVHKQFVQRRPQTTYCCTGKGKNEFEGYLKALEQLLKNK